MELSDDPRSGEQDEAPPVLLPCVSQLRVSSYSLVQQHGYSASIFLQRKEKLEQVSRYLSNIGLLLLVTSNVGHVLLFRGRLPSINCAVLRCIYYTGVCS